MQHQHWPGNGLTLELQGDESACWGSCQSFAQIRWVPGVLCFIVDHFRDMVMNAVDHHACRYAAGATI